MKTDVGSPSNGLIIVTQADVSLKNMSQLKIYFIKRKEIGENNRVGTLQTISGRSIEEAFRLWYLIFTSDYHDLCISLL